MKPVALLLLVVLLLSGCASSPFNPFATSVIYVTWEGGTDIDMLHQVQKDLAAAEKTGAELHVALISPGGPVVTSLEIARLVRNAVNKGVVVEIHGSAVVASGGTFVLASGTPGRRYIAKPTLFLVHPIQMGGMFTGPMCVDRTAVEKAASQDDKVILTLLDEMEAMYKEFTGRDGAVIRTWLTCGNEQAGNGFKAVEMGFADKVEE